MGYNLELYQLDWQQLRETIGSGDRELVAAIDANFDPRMFKGDDSAQRHILWRKVVEALVAGRRGSEIRQRTADPSFREEVTDLAALAMCGIIRSLGVKVGMLEHSGSGGDVFREEFLAALPSALGIPITGEDIICRPLSGMLHKLYPSWGGLTRAEIDKVFQTVSMDELPTLGDSDLDGWLYDFMDALEAVHEKNSDLVTLYL